jgi:hypothetical protein
MSQQTTTIYCKVCQKPIHKELPEKKEVCKSCRKRGCEDK